MDSTDQTFCVARHVVSCLATSEPSGGSHVPQGGATSKSTTYTPTAAPAWPYFAVFRLLSPACPPPPPPGCEEDSDEDEMAWAAVVGPTMEFSVHELKRRHHALALLLHPDRISTSSSESQCGVGGGPPTRSSDETIDLATAQIVPPQYSGFVTPHQRLLVIADAFAKMQTAYEVLLDPQSLSEYMALGHHEFCRRSLDPSARQRDEAKSSAALAKCMAATFMALFGCSSPSQGGSLGVTPPPTGSEGNECKKASDFPCASQRTTCAARVFMEGESCSACRQAELLSVSRKPLASQASRCKSFGCLRVVEPACTTTATSSAADAPVYCSYCLRKPRKCSRLGCLTMVAPTLGVQQQEVGVDRSAVLCEKHRVG